MVILLKPLFTIDELKILFLFLDYERHRTSRILQDLKTVGESSILMIDEKMINDPLNGSAKGIMIFSSYSYQKGNTILYLIQIR